MAMTRIGRLWFIDSANWFSAFVLAIVYSWSPLLWSYKSVKRIARFLTGTTELLRICDSHAAEQQSHIHPAVTAATAAAGSVSTKTAVTPVPPNKPAANLENEEDHDDVAAASSALAIAVAGAKQVRLSPELIHRVDLCIMYSSKLNHIRRQLESRHMEMEEPFQMLLKAKSFPQKGSITTPQAIVLRAVLEQVVQSYQLMHSLNARAATRYDSTIPQNEKKLLELWDLLMPHERLTTRYSSQWQKIGFQGKDPSTDFRGMGMLGLDDLYYLCKVYPETASRILASSHHPSSWFSFAIVGINITAYALRLVRTRFLQFTFYRFGVSQEVYHEVYCYLFDTFERHWTSRKDPPTVMDFNQVFREFQIETEREILQLTPPLLPARIGAPATPAGRGSHSEKGVMQQRSKSE